MRGFREVLEADILLQEKLLRSDGAQLKKLPQGRLKIGNHGESLYICRDGSNYVYLRRSSSAARAIKKRRFLEKRVKVMRKNVAMEKRLLEEYCSYTDETINLLLPKTYQLTLGEEAGACLGNASADRGAGHDESLRFVLKDGQRRRSKSEMIISMMLETYKIPYEYEPRVFWSNMMPPEAEKFKAEQGLPDMIVPDFGFRMPDGSKRYWEHLGMLGNWEYLIRWSKKMGFYHWIGITPGNNLIITADDRGGSISQEAIARIIEHDLKPLIGLGK